MTWLTYMVQLLPLIFKHNKIDGAYFQSACKHHRWTSILGKVLQLEYYNDRIDIKQPKIYIFLVGIQ